MITFTISPDNWEWPQWSYAILMLIGLWVAISKHGEPKIIQNYSMGEATLNTFIACVLLVAGGFFA